MILKHAETTDHPGHDFGSLFVRYKIPSEIRTMVVATNVPAYITYTWHEFRDGTELQHWKCVRFTYSFVDRGVKLVPHGCFEAPLTVNHFQSQGIHARPGAGSVQWYQACWKHACDQAAQRLQDPKQLVGASSGFLSKDGLCHTWVECSICWDIYLHTCWDNII